MVLKVRFELTRIISPIGFEPTASTVPPLEHMGDGFMRDLIPSMSFRIRVDNGLAHPRSLSTYGRLHLTQPQVSYAWPVA